MRIQARKRSAGLWRLQRSKWVLREIILRMARVLVRAFLRITDPELRSAIFHVIESMGPTPGD
jgi:hypothetical protein